VLRFLKLKIPLTFSILPYERYSEFLSNYLREKGYSVLLHQGMEPKKKIYNPGKGSIFTYMSDEEIKEIVNENIDRINPDGVNNHMGSKFTEDEDKMRVFLRVLRRRGLFFFDSRTTPNTKGYKIAKRIGVRSVLNQFFIDNKDDLDYIISQLRKVKEKAKRKGYSICIGHVGKDNTFFAIKKLKDEFLREGVEFVFLKDILKEE
ncbi:MAG: hypothetical protein DRI36_02655, partial [Caldiserica bacterium]